MDYRGVAAPLPDLGKYLERLGFENGELPDEGQPTLDALNALVFAHQTHIPFECVNSHDFGIMADLGIESLFDRIVCERRGGFCFELQTLFVALLREIGFAVHPCMARVVKANPDDPVNHQGVIVTIDGCRYYVDVGFGGPMAACAIPLEDGAGVESYGQRFKMSIVSNAEAMGVFNHAGMMSGSGAWWCIDFQTSNMVSPAPLMYLLDAPVREQDFVPLAYYFSQSPDSTFVKERIVNLRFPNGSKSIRNSTYTQVHDGEKEVRELESAEDLREVLERDFGIVAPVEEV